MDKNKTLAIGSDHAALARKKEVKRWLEERGCAVRDFGTSSEESCDYPEIAHAVTEAVAKGEVERAVLLCGTGLGMCYAANRRPGIRAALCWSEETARLAREHNDANILILPGRVATLDPWEKILAAWFETPFSGDPRHSRRIAKIEEGEQKGSKRG